MRKANRTATDYPVTEDWFDYKLTSVKSLKLRYKTIGTMKDSEIEE